MKKKKRTISDRPYNDLILVSAGRSGVSLLVYKCSPLRSPVPPCRGVAFGNEEVGYANFWFGDYEREAV